MSWDNFVEIQKVPKMYSKIKLNEISKKLQDLGREWLENKNSLILYGGVGTGKTYFAYCLAKALLSKTYYGNVIFMSSKALDERLMSEYKNFGSTKHAIETFSEIPFLFIDDFGVERSTDKMERDLLEILDFRFVNFKTTVLTTNLDAEMIEKLYGERIFSRLKSYEYLYFGTKDLRVSYKYK